MIEFRIESLDKNGARTEGANAVTWLIKEGDTLHCTCSSKEAAGYARQYFVNLNIEKKFLKDQLHHETIQLKGHQFTVETKLALEAVNMVKAYLEVMEVSCDKQTPASPTKTLDPKNPIVPTGKLKG
ncbi:hypothetical protein [Pseudomonas sp. EA_65y_Pfl1_P120]|uniref:hypothetical protein n=1 Tax=Pseudomonas sp. EA_65y_Pfl1_P120 TaxID=3088693 RepID=UPI0030D76C6F